MCEYKDSLEEVHSVSAAMDSTPKSCRWPVRRKCSTTWDTSAIFRFVASAYARQRRAHSGHRTAHPMILECRAPREPENRSAQLGGVWQRITILQNGLVRYA